MMKRFTDVVFSFLGLVVFAPISIILLFTIWSESQGSPIFAQIRVGKNGKPFWCYKLRTMYFNTGDAPTHEVSKSAVTRIGRILRATKVDEVPQLYNVLRGEMSLVGPRPCLPSQTCLIDARNRLGVYHWQPGVTGLAQVRGIDMSNPQMLAQVDAEYTQHQTMSLDLRILCATIMGRVVCPV
jgi:O-antigen biosynthesis protein WbqP